MKKRRNARSVILQQLKDDQEEIRTGGNVIKHSCRIHGKHHTGLKQHRGKEERERGRIRF